MYGLEHNYTRLQILVGNCGLGLIITDEEAITDFARLAFRWVLVQELEGHEFDGEVGEVVQVSYLHF